MNPIKDPVMNPVMNLVLNPITNPAMKPVMNRESHLLTTSGLVLNAFVIQKTKFQGANAGT